jgi:hypothetical protein
MMVVVVLVVGRVMCRSIAARVKCCSCCCSSFFVFFFPFFQCVSVSVSTFTPWWQYMHMYTTKQQYGGPFGPDPYYIYGQKSAAQGLYGFSSMGH